LDSHAAGPDGHVEFPSHPHKRVALANQKTVAELGIGRQVARRSRAIEAGQDSLVPTVHDVDQGHAASMTRIFRFQDSEVGRELNLSGRIPRGLVEIRHDLVASMFGFAREVDAANYQLEGTSPA